MPSKTTSTGFSFFSPAPCPALFAPPCGAGVVEGVGVGVGVVPGSAGVGVGVGVLGGVCVGGTGLCGLFSCRRSVGETFFGVSSLKRSRNWSSRKRGVRGTRSTRASCAVSRALPRVEEDEGAVRAPRDGVAADVGEEADRASLAVALDRRDVDVAEELLPDRHEGDPLAVGRPDVRAVRAERRTREGARAPRRAPASSPGRARAARAPRAGRRATCRRARSAACRRAPRPSVNCVSVFVPKS